MKTITALCATLAVAGGLAATTPIARAAAAWTTVSQTPAPTAGFPGAPAFAPSGAGALLTASAAGVSLAPLGAHGAPGPATAPVGGTPVAFTAAGAAGFAALLDDSGPVLELGTAAGFERQVRFPTPTLPQGPAPVPNGALAADARGDLAVVAGRSNRFGVYVERAGTGSFKRAYDFLQDDATVPPSVAVGPAGDVVVAWVAARHLDVRHTGASGRSGPVHRLGAASVHTHPGIAIDADGRISVAWWDQTIQGDDAVGPVTYSVASAARGRGFGPARRVDRIDRSAVEEYPVALKLLARAGGRDLLTWNGWADGHFVVRAASVDAGRVQMLPPVTPAGTTGELVDAAADAGGAGFVLWSDAAGLYASVSAGAGSAFGAPETVDAPQSPDVDYALSALAVDPMSGLAAVAFWDAGHGDSLAVRQPVG